MTTTINGRSSCRAPRPASAGRNAWRTPTARSSRGPAPCSRSAVRWANPSAGSHDNGQRAGVLCDRDGWQHLGLWVRVLSSDPDEYDPFDVDEVQRFLSGPIQNRKLTRPRGPL